jgi:hypothetical protein
LESLCRQPRLLPDGDAEWAPLQGGNHLGLSRLPLRFAEST